jgi:hypothetical protein
MERDKWHSTQKLETELTGKSSVSSAIRIFVWTSPGLRHKFEPHEPGAKWRRQFMTDKIFVIAICIMFFCAPTPVFALNNPQSACMDDIFRLCADDIPFISEIEDCLESNISQLSARCRREFSGPEPRSLLREEDFQ